MDDKGYKDENDLLREILLEDPSYRPENIVPIKPLPGCNIVPIPFNEFERMVPPPIEYVFSPCLQTQGIAFIYAATGLGKTLFALNLAYAIASGGSFLKYKCPKPRKVLYIDSEMPFNQIHNRLMQIKEQQGDLDFPENFSILTPDKVLPFKLPKIDDPLGQEVYQFMIEKYNYEVIVIDNLSMLTNFDENKSSEWVIVQDWLLTLRAMGKTIIVIHHAGKDKNGYRGTSRMLDCIDVAISLQPVTDEVEEGSKGKKFKVVYSKARLFGGDDILPYEVNLINGYWHYQSMEQTDLDRVVEKLNLGVPTREIAKELNTTQSRICRLQRKAERLNLLRHTLKTDSK